MSAGRNISVACANALVFGTASGARRNPSNIRQRVLRPAIERANRRLAARNLSPLPEGLTLHSLRRTYASMLFAIGRSAPEVMQQLVHSDARLMLRAYSRLMSGDADERARLQGLVDGDHLGTKRHWTTKTPAASLDPPRPTR